MPRDELRTIWWSAQYVTGLLSADPQGRENIMRADGSLTVRIFDRHGIALRYVVSHRDATYPQVADRDQTISSVSLMYVFLGESGFGTVHW
jgi:putative salt-induced outer membrane protein YdiY